MTRLLVLLLLVIPVAASADHMDVIQVTLSEKCSLEDYVAIKNDFNETWGKNHGYRAEVAAPLQSQDLSSIFWVGRTANAAAFGAAWDAWRDEQSDSKSVAAKLQKRFDECSANTTRQGYDVY